MVPVGIVLIGLSVYVVADAGRHTWAGMKWIGHKAAAIVHKKPAPAAPKK